MTFNTLLVFCVCDIQHNIRDTENFDIGAVWALQNQFAIPARALAENQKAKLS